MRKTAAICVSKLYDINPDLVEEQGFLDMLRDLISDSNPTVVANAIAALTEISENGSAQHAFKITKSVLQKLLAALNECNEWGQVFVLDALANYSPADSREAEGIIERVTPRLQHANSAVVLSAVKVIMKYVSSSLDVGLETLLILIVFFLFLGSSRKCRTRIRNAAFRARWLHHLLHSCPLNLKSSTWLFATSILLCRSVR